MTGPQYQNRNPDLLTPNALRILALVMGQAGYPPNVRQLAAAVGLSVHGVHIHLKRLKQLGLVAWDEGHCRTLTAACRFVPASDNPGGPAGRHRFLAGEWSQSCHFR